MRAAEINTFRPSQQRLKPAVNRLEMFQDIKFLKKLTKFELKTSCRLSTFFPRLSLSLIEMLILNRTLPNLTYPFQPLHQLPRFSLLLLTLVMTRFQITYDGLIGAGRCDR